VEDNSYAILMIQFLAESAPVPCASSSLAGKCLTIKYTEEILNIALNSVFKLKQTEVMPCMDIQLQRCLNVFEKETQTNIKLLPPVLNVWRQDNLISFFNKSYI